MSSTILRVKRRFEDNPQDALVLVCKRIKTNNQEEVSPSLFVFRGSVDNQEATHVKNIIPGPLKIKCPSNVGDIINKIRQERKDISARNRYEVVNFIRGLNEKSVNSDNMFDLVDITRKYNIEENEKYIYDLYTSPKDDFDISMLDDLVGIENYETDLIFGSHRDNGLQNSDEDEDDEDSNAENNYKNDYPDSDNSSIDADDMIQAMQRLDLDLSSDNGEDKIYDEPPDLFNEDIKRYGEAYAKYKARVLGQGTAGADSKSLVHWAERDDVEGYKDDSEDGFYYGQDENTEQYLQQYTSNTSDDYDTE